MALQTEVTPFQHRFGYLPRELRTVAQQDAVEALLATLPQFEIKNAVQDSRGKRVVLWDFAKKINNGNHLPSLRQEIGDCFHEGTFVPGPITRKIEDVQVGDIVYSGYGKLTKVVSTQKKIVYTPSVELKVRGSLPIRCTEDHEFLIYRFPLVCGKRMTHSRYLRALEGKVNGKNAVISMFEARKPIKVKAGDLKEGDYLLTPIEFELEDEIPDSMKDFPMYSLGYFVGNGCACISSKRVDWCGPLKKKHVAEKLVKLLEDAGHTVKYKEVPSTNSWLISVGGVELVKTFKDIFYDSDGNKLYPLWAINSKEFFEGLRDADGHEGKRSCLDSTSPSLIFGAMAAAITFGHDPCVHKLVRSKGTYANAKDLYRLNWKEGKTKENLWRDQKFLCRAVKVVKKLEGPHVVYDIGVQDKSHLFLPNFVAGSNCVSFGLANAVNYLSCVEIAKGDNESYHPSFPPYFYGISRVQIGGGRINGDGSIGSWAAEGVKKYGVLRSTFEGVPPYSGTVARRWGNRPGPPANFITEARKFPVKTYAQVTSYEQIREALVNGYPVTVASMQGFQMRGRADGGKLWGVASGSWPHQMCFIGVDDTGRRPGCYCLNSWGANAHGEPVDDAPPGGFWVDADVVTRMARQQDTFAFSQFEGFPGLDLNFFLI